MEDCRNAIVSWARWGVANHAGFTYSDGPNRMEGINKPGQLPCICDCSAWVTYTSVSYTHLTLPTKRIV